MALRKTYQDFIELQVRFQRLIDVSYELTTMKYFKFPLRNVQVV